MTYTIKFYYLVYIGVSNIRVYFYIYKAININKWVFTYYLADIYIIKLEGRERTI